MDFQQTTLSNGLRLIFSQMPSLESATLQVVIGAGSRDESPKTKGLAHFLEHMVFKGTRKYPTSQSISSRVDGIGGEINASTGKEYTNYYIRALERHLDLSFDILSQFITSPLLKPAEIEKEKGVILEEIAMYEDLPMYKAPYLFEELLYRGTSLEWDTAGVRETVKTFKRSDFENFIGNNYTVENMVLSIAGKFDKGVVISLAEKYFGKIKIKKTSNNQDLVSGEVNPGGKSQAILFSKKTEQAHIVLGVRGNRLAHPDRYKEAVVTAILGGGMSSWLWGEVREKRGLAYYVRADIEHYKDVGYIAARAGVKIDKIDEAIKVIIEQFIKIREKKVSDRILLKAKEYLKGKLALGLEDTHSVSDFFGDQLLFEGKVRTVSDVMKGIDMVTASDVQKLAKEFFTPQRLNLAIVGPFKKVEKFERLLKL